MPKSTHHIKRDTIVGLKGKMRLFFENRSSLLSQLGHVLGPVQLDGYPLFHVNDDVFGILGPDLCPLQGHVNTAIVTHENSVHLVHAQDGISSR